MKTKITIYTVLLSILAVVMFFSCDTPLSLGVKLDIEGPVVEITSPSQRKSVPKQFDLEGTINDKSSIDRMVIYAVVNNEIFPRQWRYINGAWEVSDDYGASWSPYENATWEGSANSAVWKIYVDMSIPGYDIKEGEYTFNVQAWDKADFTDDNSFKAVVLIVDLNPPKVDISYPFLYRGNNALSSDPLKSLHDILDSDPQREEPAYLGKFITQEFELKWQVDDINDVWSIDLRFYKHDTVIDNKPETPLPDNYYYKFFQNLPPVPANVNPADYIKPNGSIIIPDLKEDNPGIYDQGGELKEKISEKTTIKVVAVCYDAAGNPNQEKTLGYFIYWPLANKPWIDFKDMTDPVFPTPMIDETFEDAAFTVFPGKNIKATAYQAHGVNRVEYSLWECVVDEADPTQSPPIKGKLTGLKPSPVKNNTPVPNTPSPTGAYTTIFAWQFDVPDYAGYYVVKATAFSNKDKPSKEYQKLFRVNDISFPDFPKSVEPPATKPLFEAMNSAGTSFNIKGTVSDVTSVDTLCLAWINPDSEGYKAMSQLSYFREKSYPGWQEALKLSVGASKKEEANTVLYGTDYPYDGSAPNRLWKLKLTPAGIDSDTNRRLFTFDQIIYLDDLDIGMDKNSLKSQIFLLRAANPGNQCTIITYAPQGDTTLPTIKIDNVKIRENKTNAATCYPNVSSTIEAFVLSDTITINGKWREDSVQTSARLDLTKFFKENFEITVNDKKLVDKKALQPSIFTVVRSPFTDSEGISWDGRWTLSTDVGPGTNQIPLASLKDNLVIDAKTKDIGGNETTLTNSWMIQSDHLTLTRISSEKEDGTYSNITPTPTNPTAPTTIRIFLEFSKPVNLASAVTATPELILSTRSGNDARAVYEKSNDLNSRQYFTYTVQSGDNTNLDGIDLTNDDYLYVKGLSVTGSTNPIGNAYTAPNYAFSWSRGDPSDLVNGAYEEIRITTTPLKTGDIKESNYYPKTLPTNTSGDQLSLPSSKHIKVDTIAPTILSVTPTSSAGWYSSGDIYFNVQFSERVTVGTTPPEFPLRITDNNTAIHWTSSNSNDVRVSKDTINFKYQIQNNDTSSGNVISVKGYNYRGGDITDLAGNKLLQNALGVSDRPLTGIYVEAAPVGTPIVKIYPGTATAANTASVISNDVNGTPTSGDSTNGTKNLYTLYEPNVWLAIQGTGASYKYKTIEYSINGGTSWTTFPNTTNTPVRITHNGTYNIIARQTDNAGITTTIANYSPQVSFSWDPDNLVSRIGSENANGTYSHNSDPIKFTVYFRKPIYVSTGSTSITINAQRGGSNYTLPTITPAVGTALSDLTFTYTVLNGDTSNGNNIDVVSPGISGPTVWDGTGSTRVNISNKLTFGHLTDSPKIGKEIKILTGSLNQTPAPTFATGNKGTEGDSDFQGIHSDGSYYTTLSIPYDREVTKGTGSITIRQNGTNGGTTGYRLPAVLTEAQYNRFRNIADIDIYYIKGTNGYKNGASDTSNKYVLQYKYDPATVGNTAPGIPGTFFDAFHDAETITINVNMQAVTLTTTSGKTTLNVRLAGSSAPQVPGAAYTVTLPEGLVIDGFGNKSAAAAPIVTLSGTGVVAKPFIRIKKPQEIITTQTDSMTSPRFTITQANQPMQANVRMDCRTPSTSIYYTEAILEPSASGQNWQHNGTTPTKGADPSQPGAPTNTASTTNFSYSTPITIGTSPTITNVTGYKWRVRARAFTTSATSADSEEIAYRTVITYQLRNMPNDKSAINEIGDSASDGQSKLASGDQIWIRGGDAIGSSSIPGFPFTWEDKWDRDLLKDKRAGIRLMTLASTTLGAGTIRNATAPANNTTYTSNNHGISNSTRVQIFLDRQNDILYDDIYWAIGTGTNTFNIYQNQTGGNAISSSTLGTSVNFIVDNGNRSLNNSVWKFVTWDLNATAYIDFIRGRDTSSDAGFTESSTNVIWQYGPKRWAYQRAGWTSFKDKYPIYPGEHRWCDTGTTNDKGAINFSATFSARLDLTVNHSAVNQK